MLFLRGTAIFALGGIADPNSVEFLDKLAGEEAHPTLNRLAREAVAKMRYQQTVKQTEAKQLDSFLKEDQPPQ